jgi:membrane-bound ClpP family serine protease
MSALGLLLVLIGAALVAAEAHVPSHGALGTGAVLSMAAGIALLILGAGGATGVAVAAALGVTVAGGAWVYVLVRKALAARRMAVRTDLVGHVGVIRAAPEPVGQVFVDGELWRARVWELEEDGRKPLATGDPVVVEHVNGLTLTVRPAEEWEVAQW